MDHCFALHRLYRIAFHFYHAGNVIYRLPLLDWAVTAQGLTSATFLIGRVETSVTLSLLLVLCTPWTTVLKALRVLCVPAVFIVILGMTYRYIFLLLQKSREMLEARQSRMVGGIGLSSKPAIGSGWDHRPPGQNFPN
ncbi:MAG: hypothetical protein IPJ07_17055 [Acidobacteria bacterium]|nr:hypothetical protein [Acidobacteriota bacterium]